VGDCVYEARFGQLLSGSLMDYAVPCADASGGAAGRPLRHINPPLFRAGSPDCNIVPP